MTVKLIALYDEPNDVDEFMRHYEDVHEPLVRQIPKLQEMTVGRVVGSPMGATPYFMMVEMRFADRTSFDEAMASAENRAAGKDLMSFARDRVKLMIVESQ